MHGTLASQGAQKAFQEDFAKVQEPELRIFALLTGQGTAASETMLCADDLRVVPALLNALDGARQSASPDPRDFIDLDTATFEDVTENQEAACRWCGRDSSGY